LPEEFVPSPVVDILKARLGGGEVEPASAADGMPTIYLTRERLVDGCFVLRDDPELGFTVLIDAIPIDLFPREPRFEISYLLLNPGGNGPASRLRVKVRVPGQDARLPTLSKVWIAANWAEREAFDLFGIEFDNHPDLRRILMPDDWEGFPLRKDYPVQIKAPVKTYEPLQVSEEEFIANIQASKERPRKR
jgi:NADH-quinone oxidoreductase subunit C